MSMCDNTNELIRKVAYDVLLVTGLWGIVNVTSLVAIEDKNMKPEKASSMVLMLQLASIITTAAAVYKYS